jgi:hypothetical protein
LKSGGRLPSQKPSILTTLDAQTMPPAPVKQNELSDAYRLAQTAIADLKTAVYLVLSRSGSQGLRNADIGRALGIYTGHEKHEGHIPRTLLGLMESEGVVCQDAASKHWKLRDHIVEARNQDDDDF